MISRFSNLAQRMMRWHGDINTDKLSPNATGERSGMERINERIELLTTLHKEAANKLDYFILGATLAICAYLAQTNPYGRIGINAETFLLGSLLIFATSAICGFKRIESTVTSLGLNIFALQHEDPATREYFISLLKERKTPSRYYVARNYLLMLGLLTYLITKVWAAYQNNGWIPLH